jgi:hypothetical protein
MTAKNVGQDRAHTSTHQRCRTVGETAQAQARFTEHGHVAALLPG